METATRTRFVSEFGGVQLETTFATPALPDDLDLLSMPLTLVTFSAKATDGKAHDVQVKLHLSDKLCYDGELRPNMIDGAYTLGTKQTVYIGQETQKPLSHSADHITIDWGYLYLSADGVVKAVGDGVQTTCSLTVGGAPAQAVIAYDDIASINYFGDLCKAWYRRDGRQITDAILYAQKHFDEILLRCAAMDETVSNDAQKAGGQDYEAHLCRAQAYRHAQGRDGISLQGERFQRLHRHGGCELPLHPAVPALLPRARQCPLPPGAGICLHAGLGLRFCPA